MNTTNTGGRDVLDVDETAGKKISKILKKYPGNNFFQIEGHHAFPKWMEGPDEATNIVDMRKYLHNFNPSGFHSKMSGYWKKSKLFKKISYEDGNALEDLFKNASDKQRKVMFEELENIMDKTYKDVLGSNEAYDLAIETMKEGLKNFQY